MHAILVLYFNLYQVGNVKVSEFDQEISQAHTADQPVVHDEEEVQNTNNHMTSRRQLQ